MNIALWTVAGLLAAAFLASGAMKVLLPKEKLVVSGAGFLEGFSSGSIKAIGALEILAAFGLTLPGVLDVTPVLVPLAAVGLMLMVVGAIILQIRRHENQAMVANLVLVVLAAVVALGRFRPEHFTG